jgi:hypothetical protein
MHHLWIDSSLTTLANVKFMLACYQGVLRFEDGITILLFDYDERRRYATVYSSITPGSHVPLFTVLHGPVAGSEKDALLGLYEQSKKALVRAMDLRESSGGFHDFDDVKKMRIPLS